MLLTELVSWVFVFGLPTWLAIETLHHCFRVNRAIQQAPGQAATSDVRKPAEPRPPQWQHQRA
jgi:hypothetical protein